MMYKINFPNPKMKYIYTQTGQDWVHYGEVQSNQCLASGLDTEEKFPYGQEQAYLDRLAELGIDPENP